MIWYDMIRYDMIWYTYLTAIWLTPGGSSTVVRNVIVNLGYGVGILVHFQKLLWISFPASPGKGLRVFCHNACHCSCGVIWPVLDSEQRLFILNRNGAANNGSYVYAFKTHRNYRNPRSLKMSRINWVHKHRHCYLHALETCSGKCMKILDDFTYFQEQFSLGRQAGLVHMSTCISSISEFGERNCLRSTFRFLPTGLRPECGSVWVNESGIYSWC
jgi:hypothetical protein